MKLSVFSRPTLLCLLAVFTSEAVEIKKEDNTTALNLTGSWVSGVVPGADDVALWDAPYNRNPSIAASLGADLTWKGIRVASPTSVPRIRNTSGRTLTLGSSGIDMSGATQNFDLYQTTALSANQEWNVASGRTLTVSASLSGSGVTLTKAGTGALNLMAATSLPMNLALQEGTLTVGHASGTVELTGVLSGSGTLSKSAAGVLTLSGDNSTYAGSFTHAAGTLNLHHASALGSSTLLISGGSLGNASGAAVTLTGNAAQTWGGTISFAGPDALHLGNTAVTITTSADVAVSGTALASVAGAVTASAGALTKSGTGTLQVNTGAAVDISGKIAVNHGVLQVNGGTLRCGSSGTSSLEISGGIIELLGGVTDARSVTRPIGTGTLRFKGGVLRPRGDSATFISGLTAAEVGSGGAKIELDGWFVTVPQPLLHDPSLGSTADDGLRVSDLFGNGRLTLTGASTFTGPTVIESGTLRLGAGASIAASSVIEVQQSGTFDGQSGTTVSSGQTVRGTGTLLGKVTIGAGATLSPGVAGVGEMQGDILVLQGETVMDVSKVSGVITHDKVMNLSQLTYGGTLTVTKTGEAFAPGDKVVLFEAFSYAGSFTTVHLPPLPSGLFWETSGLTVDGSIEVVNTIPRPVFSPPGGAYLDAQSVTISAAAGATIHYTIDGSDPLTSGTKISAASPVTGVVVPAGSSNFTIRAYASLSGFPDSVVATAIYQILDTGTWSHNSSGLWSDPTKWLYGLVPTGVGITADFSTMTLAGSATVTLDSTPTIGVLKFGDGGGGSNWTLASSSLTLDHGPAKPGIHVANNSATITTALAGSNGFVKTGAGTLVAQLANNSLSGTAVISQGSVLVDRTNSLGSGTIVLGDPQTGAAEAAILQRGSDPWPPAADFGTTNNITVAAGPTGRLVIGRQSAGNYAANFTGTITLQNNVVFRNNGGDRLSIEGKITGTGHVTIEGNRVNWNSPLNDFVGDLTVAAGGVFQPNATTTIPAPSNVTVNGSMGTNSATGETLVIGSLSGSGNIYRLASGNPTLAIGGNNGNGHFQGVIQNDFPVLKTGSGTQILSGANTYTGGTTVSGGTLLVNNTTGSGTGTGAVLVNANATLGGSGSITGAVASQSGSFLAPGSNGIGTLTTGPLTLAGTYRCELDGSSADQIAVTGNLNLTGSALQISTISPSPPGTYVIATYTGTLIGTFGGALPAGYALDYSTANQIRLIVPTGSDPFAHWASANGITGGKNGDDDGDGVKNLVEFATNSNASAAAGGAAFGPRCYPLIYQIGVDRVLTYTIATRKSASFSASGSKQVAIIDQIRYTVEASSDLSVWNVVGVTEVTGQTATDIRNALGTVITSPALAADWEWHTFRVSPSTQAQPNCHIRLHVEEAAP